jgi:hypothetical protein
MRPSSLQINAWHVEHAATVWPDEADLPTAAETRKHAKVRTPTHSCQRSHCLRPEMLQGAGAHALTAPSSCLRSA